MGQVGQLARTNDFENLLPLVGYLVNNIDIVKRVEVDPLVQ